MACAAERHAGAVGRDCRSHGRDGVVDGQRQGAADLSGAVLFLADLSAANLSGASLGAYAKRETWDKVQIYGAVIGGPLWPNITATILEYSS